VSSAHQTGTSRRSALLAGAAATVLLASVTLNVVQASRIREYLGAREAQPRPGTIAPPLVVKSLAGQSVEVTFGEQPTILYYFSPSCGWCERNWLNIKTLIAGTEGRYRFIGLSTTGDITAYLAKRGLSFEVYTGLSLEAARAYHFGGTPHTVVVRADGRVERAWAGAFASVQQLEVERAFGIVLPGVQKVGPLAAGSEVPR
jgi:hypothetical protein